MDAEKLKSIATRLGGDVSFSTRSALLTVRPERLKDACEMVSSVPGLYHLSTVTGIDNGTAIEVMYHFWMGREFISVRTYADRSSPSIPSVTPELPAALLYEAEVHDLLGVTFTGNPLMGRRLLLPDNYPKDAPPPLRKEANPEEIRRLMHLE